MASREFTVGARITADTASAQRNVRALNAALAENSGKVDALRAKYDAGEISAAKFVRQQASLERQSAKLTTELRRLGGGAEEAEGRFARLTSFLASRMVVTLGDVANASRLAFDAIRAGAQRIAQEDALRSQIQRFDEFIAKLQQVSQGTISQADLIASASKAVLLGIPTDRIAELLEIARGASVALGTDVAQAFDDIVRGIGRASPLILDNLGLIVKLEEANKLYADAVGKTVSELSGQEQSLALLDSVIANNIEKYRALASSQNEVVTSLDKGTAALRNAKDGAVQFGTALLQSVLGGLSATVVGIELAVEAVTKLTRGFVAALQRLPVVGSLFDGIADSLRRFDDALDVSQQKFAQYAIDFSNGAAAGLGFVESQDRVARSIAATRREAESSGPVMTVYRNHVASLAVETEALADQTRSAVPELRSVAAEYDAAAASIVRYANAVSSANRVTGRVGVRGGSRLARTPGFGGSLRTSTLSPSISGGLFSVGGGG